MRTVIYKTILMCIFLMYTGIIFSSKNAQQAEYYYVKGIEAYKSNNLEDAIDSFEKCIFYNEQDGRELPYRSANAAQWKAYTYHRLGNDSLAAKIHPYYKVKPYDDIISLTADSLANIAMIEAGNNNYELSISHYSNANKLYANIGDSLSIAGCLHEMAGIYLQKRESTMAKPLIDEALTITKNMLGEDNIIYSIYLDDLASYNYQTENYSTSTELWNKTLAATKKEYGVDSEEYSIILNHLALSYCALNEYERAEALYVESLNLMSRHTKENFSDYILTMGYLGGTYFHMGKYSEAESMFLQALNLIENNGQQDIELYEEIAGQLGALYSEIEEYGKAEPLLIRVLNSRESRLDKSHPDYIYSLKQLANFYYIIKDYTKAELLLLQALNLIENYGQQNIELYEEIAGKLGVLYSEIEEYGKAEPLLIKVLDSRKSRLDKSHPDYIYSLKQLANYYCLIRDYSKAESLFKQLLGILKESSGPLSQEYLYAELDLATLYHNKEDIENSAKLFFDAFKSLNYIVQDNTQQKTYRNEETLIRFFNAVDWMLYVCAYIDNTAEIPPAELKKLKENEDIFFSNLESTFKEILKSNDDFATDFIKIRCTRLLADLYLDTNRISEAEELLNSTLAQTEANNIVPDISIIVSLCELYARKNEIDKMKPYMERIYNERKKQLISNFTFMSEQQREQFFFYNDYVFFTEDTPHFCYKDYINCDSISCLAYDNELFKKGLLLNISNEIQRSILESGDSALIDKWRALQQTKERIIKLQSQSKDNHTVLAELESKAEQLDKELTKASAAYREANSQFNISWKDVQQKLKQNDVAIEFVSFQDSADVTYYALLLKKDYTYPKLIPLCTEREIAQLFDPTDKKRAAYKYSQTNHLYDNLWSKIAPYIDNGANIYYSPSGILHLMNLEAIPVNKDTYLGDKYNMNRLSSTRELVLADDNTADKTAVLYGGIKYDLSADDMAKESERYASDEYLLATRSIEAETDSLYRGGVRELPGTKAEAEAISRMLDSKFNTITTFFADSANEESFKALSGKRYNILHIGTHGFFWPIETASRQELFKSRMHGLDSDETARYNPLADPMQRSGLLFAGASLAISGKADSLAQNVEDGILTAKEIANIDLKEADLVVLSACETGKGEISGEGVFGLQRGFKQAGAKTIIMSLWKVNDVATKDFMLSFYKHLTNGDSKREAFKAAILDTRKGYPEPDCWASFVMMD